MQCVRLKYLLVLLVASLLPCRAATLDTEMATILGTGADLTTFVSRPDIRAPKWNITKHDPDRVAPGFIFAAPYSKWGSRPLPQEWEPAQVGPCIYDLDGNLVWSGASIDRNRNAQDFRPYHVGDETRLSYILAPLFLPTLKNSTGVFVTMDNNYQKLDLIVPPTNVNGHEFNIIDDGRSALVVTTRSKELEPYGPDDGAGHFGRYSDDCVAEMNMTTGQNEFEWCGLDHGISPDDTYEKLPEDLGQSWDFLHVNSVDKFDNGDLLFSARYTSTIYRVSRADNSIVWRLGGKHSDFTSDFSFSSQHNARIISQNSSVQVLSMLDNASLEPNRNRQTANVSSAKLVALYTSEQPMRAKLLRQWDRPDGDLSRKRGNVDMLPNGNVWVAWSEQAYTTEQTVDGEVLFEGKFTSPRFSTYRAYKAPWVGKPLEPPAIKALQHTTVDNSIMAAYVSWNGATEVASWRFMGQRSGSNETIEIATLAKTGFETSVQVSGLWSSVSAFALDVNGTVLSFSPTVATTLTKASSSMSALSGVKATLSQTWTALSSRPQAPFIATVVLLTILVQSVLLGGFFVYRRFARRSQNETWTLGMDQAQAKEADVPLLKWDSDNKAGKTSPDCARVDSKEYTRTDDTT
ncbi:hypothetical protein K461DRAFT_282108 [Myriangium duriaei CBS 260.36]|uniref:Arylsulfotransferase N-terminal domain-containing protein n=1 Tax=Myriangium duriaei CBS 260.36 TaxID=1168546 RepID=A0A9P4IVR7_9PEZI|nr:hypothetical protein K461DRAFT_282108 [Myriangium duriaei CBS 260.36]